MKREDGGRMKMNADERDRNEERVMRQLEKRMNGT